MYVRTYMYTLGYMEPDRRRQSPGTEQPGGAGVSRPEPRDPRAPHHQHLTPQPPLLTTHPHRPMASPSTTPVQFSTSTGKNVKPSNSRPNSRPATPLRRSSRGSQHGKSSTEESFPLNVLEPAFAELSDAMATLEADMGDMQIMHDSLSRFSESFASFLYGLNMNAFCMDFTEVQSHPTPSPSQIPRDIRLDTDSRVGTGQRIVPPGGRTRRDPRSVLHPVSRMKLLTLPQKVARQALDMHPINGRPISMATPHLCKPMPITRGAES